MSQKTQKAVADSHDFELSQIPDKFRRNFFSMFVIMMGFTFFSASMWAGGNLGAGLTLKDYLIAVLIGNLILGAYTGLLAYISSKTRLSVHLLSRYSFGAKGSYLPSSILALTQVGWFGVGVAMFAIPVSIALVQVGFMSHSWIMMGSMTSIGAEQIPSRLLYTIVAVSGLLMTSTAYWGIKALSFISIIAVPSIAIFGCYSAYYALFQEHGVDFNGAVNGFEYIKTYVPSDKNSLTMAAAISIAVGSFISGGTCTPDFARFSKSSKIAVWTTVLAFFIGNSLMFFFGAAGAMVYNQSDISIVLKLQGLLLPAVVVLGLNIWTTNDNALYTSGLGLSNITKFSKKYIVIFNGVLGTIASVWLYNNFCGWLNFLNTIIPPIGVILITDYFIIDKLKKRGMYKTFETESFDILKWAAVIAWFVGSVVALIGSGKIDGINVGLFSMGVPAINGAIATFIVYILLSFRKK